MAWPRLRGHESARFLIRLFLGLFLTGCAGPGERSLMVVTSWSDPERAALEAEFRDWLPRSGEADPGRIVWVSLEPGRDPTRVASQVAGADLTLGGPLASYSEGQRSALWAVARRAPIGLAVRWEPDEVRSARAPESLAGLADPEWLGRVAIGDPRDDPMMRALVRARLDSGPWTERYAELVRLAGNARPIGRGTDSAVRQVEQGQAALAPAVASRLPDRSEVAFVRLRDAPQWVEGAGLVAGADHPAEARAFLRFLNERGDGSPFPRGNQPIPLPPRGRVGVGAAGGVAAAESSRSSGPHPSPPPGGEGARVTNQEIFEPNQLAPADDLLADLLGATLVDAQEELRAAWAAVVREGRPPAWEDLLTESPPWPPASVQKMQTQLSVLGEEKTPTPDELAAQIAPDPAVRSWLLESWARPPQSIHGAWLVEAAGAVGGRLAAEPRFRAWLRGEWTEWARRRYRWITRKAGGPPP